MPGLRCTFLLFTDFADVSQYLLGQGFLSSSVGLRGKLTRVRQTLTDTLSGDKLETAKQTGAKLQVCCENSSCVCACVYVCVFVGLRASS